MFFDNVGGDALNAALARIANRARVVICGGISRYSAETLPPGPANYFNIVFRQASIEGFLLRGYEREYGAGPADVSPNGCGRERSPTRKTFSTGSRTFPPPCCGCSRARTLASSCCAWIEPAIANSMQKRTAPIDL